MNIDGQEIENVKICLYLGSEFTWDNDCSKDTMITLAAAVYSELQSIWKDSGIMIDIKLQLLMTIVFPVLLYAAETRTTNKADEKDYLHLRWGVTDVFWQWNGTIEELMKRYEQLYNEKKQWWIQSEWGSYNVWVYLQDARWSTVKDIIVWNGRGWASSGTTCTKIDWWHFEVVWLHRPHGTTGDLFCSADRRRWF